MQLPIYGGRYKFLSRSACIARVHPGRCHGSVGAWRRAFRGRRGILPTGSSCRYATTCRTRWSRVRLNRVRPRSSSCRTAITLSRRVCQPALVHRCLRSGHNAPQFFDRIEAQCAIVAAVMSLDRCDELCYFENNLFIIIYNYILEN